MNDPQPKSSKIMLIILLLVTGFCICTVCVLVSYYVWGNQFKIAQTSKNPIINYQQSASDGSVFGTYQTPNGSDVHFAVTKDGFATFGLEGADESETLLIGLQEDRTVQINWAGITLDGFGELTTKEQAALERLQTHNLASAFARIPLDIACQGGDILTPKQVAALLVPLQMQFKYLISNRIEEANRLIALSSCNYNNSHNHPEGADSLIQFSSSMPVPVVYGYFPFDSKGAIESPESSTGGPKSACQRQVDIGPLTAVSSPEKYFLSMDGDIYNETGPCNAKCRGACGPDCILSNCKHTEERRCEKDEMGRNTGMVVIADVYDCGLHEGCIEHDLCYDACNAFLGCDTWAAAACRHGWVLSEVTEHISMCDETAIIDYGPVDPVLWARGHGPQPHRKVFVYPNEDFEKTENQIMCPVDDADKQEVEKETSDENPEDSKGEAPPEKQPAEKEPQPMGPCDVMPPGAKSTKVDGNQCIQQYADQPGEMIIQIFQAPGFPFEEEDCQSWKESEFHIVMKEVDYGICGYQVQPAVNGTPGILGYGGWSILYLIDEYSVRVHTDSTYPTNQAWVYGTANEIEAYILNNLDE